MAKEGHKRRLEENKKKLQIYVYAAVGSVVRIDALPSVLKTCGLTFAYGAICTGLLQTKRFQPVYMVLASFSSHANSLYH
jgi:hypothetical protein